MNEKKQLSNQIILLISGFLILLVVIALIAFFAIGMKPEETSTNTTPPETTITAGGTEMYPSKTIAENIKNAPELSTTVNAISTAGLIETLNSEKTYTVFIPSNTAFDIIPTEAVNNLLLPENITQLQSLLQMHIVQGKVLTSDIKDNQRVKTISNEELVFYTDGSKITVNGATLVTRDITLSNGVIHIIDALLFPPSPSVTVNGVSVLRSDTIAVSATKIADLSTLVSVIQSTGLADALTTAGNYTVFAPRNSAFTSLPAGTLETLQLPENKSQLTAIVTYHVVAGSYTTAQLYDGQKLVTLGGQSLTVRKNGAIVELIGASDTNVSTITTPDITQSNGVIHIVDAILMPTTPSTTPSL